MNKYIVSIFFVLVFTYTSEAQEHDSMVFAKGRVLSSLYGNISNQYADVSSRESIKTTGYRIGTKSGVFLKDNWTLGINFSLSRTDFERSNIKLDSEDFLIGLWSRLYFAKNGNSSLYAEITPHYTSIYNANIIQDHQGAIISNEDVYGKGYGIIPGLGFTYIISKNVGFGMSLSYTASKIFLDRTNLALLTKNSDTYNVSELQFNFNFQIYLDQFFF